MDSRGSDAEYVEWRLLCHICLAIPGRLLREFHVFLQPK
jgi:hypothetical protein